MLQWLAINSFVPLKDLLAVPNLRKEMSVFSISEEEDGNSPMSASLLHDDCEK